MNFVGDPVISHGVVERRFDVAGSAGPVPGIAWTPEGADGARPLVLVGHGGGGHKRMPYVLSVARRLVRHAGYAVAAIDGPGHGDRAGATLTREGAETAGIPQGFIERMAALSGQMTADWTTTLGELRMLPEVGEGPLGYWGLSMGTMLGLPFVAATPDVRCAVLGLMGTFADDNPWTVAAGAITCPTLFLVQTDDELIPMHTAVSLFQSLASKDKRLHAHPGRHSAVPAEEIDASEAFFAQHL